MSHLHTSMLPVSRLILLIFLANLFNTVTSAAIVLQLNLRPPKQLPRALPADTMFHHFLRCFVKRNFHYYKTPIIEVFFLFHRINLIQWRVTRPPSLLRRDEHFSVPRRTTFIAYVSLNGTVRVWSYKKSMTQESKDSGFGITGFKYSRIREFLNYCSRWLANCSPLPFRRLRFCSRSHVALLLVEVYRSFFFFFLKNKYVSPGKQEAISAGLADEAIPAIL